MSIELYSHQLDALSKMKNGCILNGGVGSGKTLTSLSYYYLRQGGKIDFLKGGSFTPMNNPKDLYIITTAHKRDILEWETDMMHLLMTTAKNDLYSNTIKVDSWNNIKKYQDITDAFFIFDEQRVVGYGTWTKSFLKIAKHNEWILLSATPGDKWEDYMPVFIANGFYKNKTDFVQNHIIYDYRAKYPRVSRYWNTGRLIRLRNSILIDMDVEKRATSHHEDVYADYDISLYKDVFKRRIDPFKEETLSNGKVVNPPLRTASELCYILRRIVNTDESRVVKLLELLEKIPRAIIFYNFDYELELLKSIHYGEDVVVAEWNGHKHESIPDSEHWVYLVQYNAGAEGWNCIKTDTIIFYSQNYSYRMTEQARGRIDRLNTPYTDLYYYHFKSKSGIDLAISRALSSKKKFNESRWIDGR